MNGLSISKLSELVNLPAKTIRFYEETGLTNKAKRASNGYRVYDDANVEELLLIKNARDLGLPISEIRKLMIGCDDGSCDHLMKQVRVDIQSYIKQLESRIAQFEVLKEKLVKLDLEYCDKCESCEDDKCCCNILYQLTKKGGEER